jgi:hypothetical protein
MVPLTTSVYSYLSPTRCKYLYEQESLKWSHSIFFCFVLYIVRLQVYQRCHWTTTSWTSRLCGKGKIMWKKGNNDAYIWDFVLMLLFFLLQIGTGWIDWKHRMDTIK